MIGITVVAALVLAYVVLKRPASRGGFPESRRKRWRR